MPQAADGTAAGHRDKVHERWISTVAQEPARNVLVNRTAEASAVSLVRDDAPCAADQAYGACRSGSG